MEQNVSAETLKGTVVFFSADKGYGFLRVGTDQYFVHHTEILAEGYRSLEKYQLVEFEPTKTDKGLAAKNVRKVAG